MAKLKNISNLIGREEYSIVTIVISITLEITFVKTNNLKNSFLMFIFKMILKSKMCFYVKLLMRENLNVFAHAINDNTIA